MEERGFESPFHHRNPSPPPELLEGHADLVHADNVGQSAFSKQWIFSVLMKLIQSVDQESKVGKNHPENDKRNPQNYNKGSNAEDSDLAKSSEVGIADGDTMEQGTVGSDQCIVGKEGGIMGNEERIMGTDQTKTKQGENMSHNVITDCAVRKQVSTCNTDGGETVEVTTDTEKSGVFKNRCIVSENSEISSENKFTVEETENAEHITDDKTETVHTDGVGKSYKSQENVTEEEVRCIVGDKAESILGIDVDDDLQTELCQLWDMSTDQDVCKFLAEYQTLDLLTGIIARTKAPRVAEICSGIVANMACVDEICVALAKDSKVVELFVMLLDSRDAPTLNEVVRCLVYPSEQDALSKLLHTCTSNDKATPTFLTHIKAAQDTLQNIIFILSSSTNIALLKNTAELVDTLLDKDSRLIEDYSSIPEFVDAILEAIQQLRSVGEELDALIHALQLLSTSDIGVDALVQNAERVQLTLQKYLDFVCDFDVGGVEGREKTVAAVIAVYNVLFSSSTDVATNCLESENFLSCLLKILEPLPPIRLSPPASHDHPLTNQPSMSQNVVREAKNDSNVENKAIDIDINQPSTSQNIPEVKNDPNVENDAIDVDANQQATSQNVILEVKNDPNVENTAIDVDVNQPSTSQNVILEVKNDPNVENTTIDVDINQPSSQNIPEVKNYPNVENKAIDVDTNQPSMSQNVIPEAKNYSNVENEAIDVDEKGDRSKDNAKGDGNIETDRSNDHAKDGINIVPDNSNDNAQGGINMELDRPNGDINNDNAPGVEQNRLNDNAQANINNDNAQANINNDNAQGDVDVERNRLNDNVNEINSIFNFINQGDGIHEFLHHHSKTWEWNTLFEITDLFPVLPVTRTDTEIQAAFAALLVKLKEKRTQLRAFSAELRTLHGDLISSNECMKYIKESYSDNDYGETTDNFLDSNIHGETKTINLLGAFLESRTKNVVTKNSYLLQSRDSILPKVKHLQKSCDYLYRQIDELIRSGSLDPVVSEEHRMLYEVLHGILVDVFTRMPLESIDEETSTTSPQPLVSYLNTQCKRERVSRLIRLLRESNSHLVDGLLLHSNTHRLFRVMEIIQKVIKEDKIS